MRRTLFAAAVAISVFLLLATQGPAAEQKPGQKPKREPGRWALLVGVDDYTELGKLRFAGNDQRALADQFIAAGFPKDQVYLLHDTVLQRR
jgi:hypothetical protein